MRRQPGWDVAKGWMGMWRNSDSTDGPAQNLSAIGELELDALARTFECAPQERRIMQMVLDGRHDKEIAVTMQLKVPTVRTYLRRIFDKTGACDRRELMAVAFARMSEIRAASQKQERGGTE